MNNLLTKTHYIMEHKPEENQKQFVVHSDENHEWLYNGRDSIKLFFHQRESYRTCKTIYWRGITFHIRISAPERQTAVKYVYYSIIFNERIYYRRLSRHYAGGAMYGDKPPVIETDKYFLEILFGLQCFSLTEKVKPIETASAFLVKENVKPKDATPAVLVKENDPVKFSDLLRSLFSTKEVNQIIKPEIPEPKKSEPKQIDSVTEDSLFRVCSFKIVNASEDIRFDFPERKKEDIEIRTNQVTLYEFSNPNISVNSYAYFEKNDLVVDYWKLGYSYEDEEFIVVNERFVSLVYKEFKIVSENKFQLLIGILNAFNGKGSYEKFEEFLKSKNIPYGYRVRHDDEIGG